MKKPLLLLTSALLAACGNISDPSHVGSEHVAAVSGALSTSGTVPANAHVALVWNTGSGLAVGADVPVVNGAFTMELDVPPDAYFRTIDTSSSGTSGFGSSSSGSGSSAPSSGGTNSGGPSAPPPVETDSGILVADAGVAPNAIHRNDGTSGTISGPLEGAVAGFVAYVDANGDGKLDLSGSYASSPDTLIAGAADLALVYLRGGGPLDLQRLADKSGKTPSLGYDLALTEGQWVALNLVELTLSSSPQLPSGVCSSSSIGSSDTPTGTVSSGGSAGSTGSNGGSSGSGGVYPSPTDPGLTCAPDGSSYTYNPPQPTCPPPTPAPVGLCTGDAPIAVGSCPAQAPETVTLPPGGVVPTGWPCPVASSPGTLDAGAPVDAAVVPVMN